MALSIADVKFSQALKSISDIVFALIYHAHAVDFALHVDLLDQLGALSARFM